MSDEPKYEDLKKLLHSLPVPDEEQAWQKMKQLLEEKEDDRPLPFFFLKGCAGWGLLFGLLLSGVLVFFWPKPGKKPAPLKQDSSITTSTNKKETATKTDSIKNFSTKPVETNKNAPVQKKEPETVADTLFEKQLPQTGISRITAKKEVDKKHERKQKSKARTNLKQPAIKVATAKMRAGSTGSASDTTPKTNPPQPLPGAAFSDSTIAAAKDTIRKTSDTALKKKDINTDLLIAPANKNPKQKKGGFYVGAGLALLQQIPLAGQTITPYNQYGREGSLADYVPAPFVRLYKGDTWFAQADFRYGAPQAAKVLAYSASTVSDSAQDITTTTTLRLKKTFYHQASLSFNHTVFPNWTVGAGGMYSRFYKAVSEREIKNRNNQSGIETVSKTIVNVPAGNDSAFTVSQLHLLLQTEYRRKRWGAGLRYTKGLQPFLRYTHNGVLMNEKAHALQFYVRYQVWQSKKKKP